MDESGKFYAVVWGLVALVLLGFTVSYAVCNAKDNDTMLNMVKAGANPLDARCAVLGNGNSAAFDCNLVMVRK